MPLACAALGEGEFAPNLAVAIEGTELLIGAHNTNDGSKLSAEGMVAESAQGNALLRLPLASAFSALSVEQALGRQPVDFGQTFTLSLPGHAPAVVKVPPIPLGWAIINVLANVVKGPVTFGTEAPAPAAHSVLFVERGFANPLIGTAKTVGEIDWVAVKTKKGEHEIGTCDYKWLSSRPGAASSGSSVSAKKLGLEETVTIYARRTGTVVDRRDFRATEGPCPSSLRAGEREVRVEIDLEQVRTWLTARIAK